MAGLDLNSRNNDVPYGGVSMTPKSRYEQRHFGFEPRNGFDQRFDSLSLVRHQADQQRLLNEERMIQERMQDITTSFCFCVPLLVVRGCPSAVRLLAGGRREEASLQRRAIFQHLAGELWGRSAATAGPPSVAIIPRRPIPALEILTAAVCSCPDDGHSLWRRNLRGRAERRQAARQGSFQFTNGDVSMESGRTICGTGGGLSRGQMGTSTMANFRTIDAWEGGL